MVGCCGSGKSTLARRLAAMTGLPLIHLDNLWWRPDKTHISREEFDARLAEIGRLESWIIDGNYSRTLETRMRMCDTVILFDLPVRVCLQGALDRLGKGRYDMPWIDTELDPRLRYEIEAFPEKNLPAIHALIEKYGAGRQVVVFKSREEAEGFLQALPCTPHG